MQNMYSVPDLHVEIARLQQQIEQHLGVEGDLVFDYQQEENRIKLNLITINRRHNQSFLFHNVYGIDKPDALQKMLDYARQHREQHHSYTIQWRGLTTDKELQTSYFRGSNMYEALDKLYFNRDMHSITVYSIVLNPEA